ncbi:ArnT family glycosyltransferase [Sneathiella chinensis]|uniref:Glycosyltransferase RgtA/B/C/D-like domain-containing protein n=1 Tax=Sneathiella chinensis TaxID=349750 RepID=A0ABQ5U632_9PROT|nr:glycosyltransferase family 39 protein [Sneathiella chinensis]GLQ05951.1 hypothetical protein GCM10007924_11720 [Sneathiella chinensis]
MSGSVSSEGSFPGRKSLDLTIFSAGLFIILSLVGLWIRPLLPVDETRYLSVAWEMWVSGDYLIPTKNGEIYTHKPPLLFWLINLVWWVTGVSEFAARLVGPAAGVVALFLTRRLCRVLWPDAEQQAGTSALIFATSMGFLLLASLTMFDALLTVGVLIAILGIVRLDQTGSLKWLLVFAFGLAFGGMSKGPVVLVHVLPVALFLPFLPTSRWGRGKALWYAAVLGGVVGGIAIVSLWLVPALIAGGPVYQEAVLWKQSAGRITNSFSHGRPFWFYLALVPVFLWPWGWRLSSWRKGTLGPVLREPGAQVSLLWIGGSFLIFSLISGKQIHYLMPEMPALAFLLARLFDSKADGRMQTVAGIAPFILVWAALILAMVGVIPLDGLEGALSRPAMLAAIAGTTLYIVVVWLCRRSQLIVLASMAPALLGIVYLVAASPLSRMYDANEIAGELAKGDPPAILYIAGKYHGEFTFAGRLTRPVDVLIGDDVAVWIKNNPGGVIVGRLDKPTPNFPYDRKFVYRKRPYAIWRVPREKS